MIAKGTIIGAALVLALSAPATAGAIFDDNSGIGLDTSGTAYMNALYGGYEALSQDRGDAYDWIDAEHFNHKARRAARRSSTIPDAITRRGARPAGLGKNRGQSASGGLGEILKELDGPRSLQSLFSHSP